MREFKPRLRKKERDKNSSHPTGLVLTRRVGEVICIGDDVLVTVVEITSNHSVRLCITAPKEISVDRLEIRQRKDQDTE